MANIRGCVLGAGYFSQYHFDAWQRIPEVEITAIEPVGNYAVKIVFSDGHDTGLYSWDYLYELGKNETKLWQQYVEKLAVAGLYREAVVAKPAPAAPATKTAWKKI